MRLASEVYIKEAYLCLSDCSASTLRCVSLIYISKTVCSFLISYLDLLFSLPHCGVVVLLSFHKNVNRWRLKHNAMREYCRSILKEKKGDIFLNLRDQLYTIERDSIRVWQYPWSLVFYAEKQKMNCVVISVINIMNIFIVFQWADCE